MKNHEFDIAISPDGSVRIEVKGTKGPECEQYISLFQEIIQGDLDVERTSAYYEQPNEVDNKINQKW